MDYGTGVEAALVQLEMTTGGEFLMRRYADRVDFAAIDWPSLPLHSNNEPYTMSQEDQDEAALNHRWVPRITSPCSASNSAFGRFRPHQQAQRFPPAHDQINLIFRTRRYPLAAISYRHACCEVFSLRADYTAEMAA